jgi:catechol 2,3-dioxygenase-like lactoylglutathione lyase family enzyme
MLARRDPDTHRQTKETTIMPKTASSIRITKIHTVGVPVTDQDKTLDFFVRGLGFDIRVDVPMPGLPARWIEVAPPASTVTVALVAQANLPIGVETGIRFVTADVEGDHADLVAQGVEVDEILRWPGVPAMFAFRDPDGNGYELIEGDESEGSGAPS